MGPELQLSRHHSTTAIYCLNWVPAMPNSSHTIQIRYHLLFSDNHFTPYNSTNAEDLCFNRDYPTLRSRAKSPPWHIHRCETLTHWGRVTHICVGELMIIGSNKGLSPDRQQAIIWTNAGLLSIGALRTYVSDNLINIQQFTLNKLHVKMSSAKLGPSFLGLNVLYWL